MAAESSRKMKDDLLKAIDGAGSAAQANMPGLQDELRDTRLVAQVAKSHRMAIEAIPEDKYLSESDWTRRTDVWDAAKASLKSGRGSKLLLGLTSSTTVVSAASLSDMTIYCQPLPADSEQTVQRAAKETEEMLRAANWDDRLETMLVQFGLDQAATDGISALDHYRRAHSAYNQPSDATPDQKAVLIGMRECISRVLADLLGKCPGQERARSLKTKVKSIARRIGKPGIAPGSVDGLATDVYDLCDELSTGKQKAYGDATLRRLYLQSIGVLKALLEMLDESRMRGRP